MNWLKEHAAEVILTVIVLAAGAGVYAYAHKDEGRLEESKRRGALIVDALTAYRGEQGTYPAALDELVPRYTPELPPPTWGLQRWRYRRYEAEAAQSAAPRPLFQLSVAANESGYPVLYYDIAAGRWVLNN